MYIICIIIRSNDRSDSVRQLNSIQCHCITHKQHGYHGRHIIYRIVCSGNVAEPRIDLSWSIFERQIELGRRIILTRRIELNRPDNYIQHTQNIQHIQNINNPIEISIKR